MNSPVKWKSAVPGVCLIPVLVLAGCGSEKEDAVGSATSAPTPAATSTSATSNVTAAPTTSAVPTTSAAPVTSTQKSEVPSAAAPRATPAQAGAAALPAAPEQINVPPITGGRPGTPEEQRAITELLKRQEQVTTVHGYLNNFAESLCADILNQQGGPGAFALDGIPDMPLTMLPEYAQSKTSVVEVKDVKVDGNRATADVTTVTGAGESATTTTAFRNENGKWKVCS